MSISTTTSQSNLIRTDVWSKEVQEELQEELFGTMIIDMISDFPDGNEIHLPTFSSLAARNYTQNADIIFDDISTGEFTLTIDKYYQLGVAITDKLKQDSFYVAELQSKFPAAVVRGLMERLENDIFLLHKEQTTNDANTINGQAHRYVGTGGSNKIALKDVAQAKLSLDKANVSKQGRVAIIDPTVSYQLIQIDNVIRQDVYGANTTIKEGFGGTKFIGTYLGFDFYESNMLDEATALDHAAGGSLKGNLFLGPEAFKGAVRQMPDIEFDRNVGKKRDEYSATMRFGLGLFRAESLVTILTA
jgi:hypothetical protein